MSRAFDIVETKEKSYTIQATNRVNQRVLKSELFEIKSEFSNQLISRMQFKTWALDEDYTTARDLLVAKVQETIQDLTVLSKHALTAVNAGLQEKTIE